MRRRVVLSSLFFGGVLFSVVGCGLGGGDKIPVTTSSSKAREYYLEGRSLADRLRQTEANDMFRKAVAEDPQFALGYLALAQSSTSPKAFFANLDRAKSLADHASQGESLLISAADAAANGDPTRQGQYLAKLQELFPNDARVYDQLGNYYFGQQKYDSAIAVYRQSNMLDPGFSSPYNMLGYSYRFMGNFEDAEKAFRKYMELIPDDPNPYDSYADLLLKMGRYEESIQSYQRALDVKSDFAPSYLGVATDLNFLGRYGEARETLRKYLAIAADDGQRRVALQSMVVSYADEGLLDSALVTLEAMLKLAQATDDAAAQANDYDNMGLVLLHQDRPDQAMEKFTMSQQVIDKSSLFPNIKENARLDFLQRQSLVALWKNQLDRADSLAHAYLSGATEADNPFRIRAARQALGMIALKKKNYVRAVSDLQQADLQQAYNIFHLAQAYEGLGDEEEAQRRYRQVADFNQLNSLMYAFVRHQALAKVESAEHS